MEQIFGEKSSLKIERISASALNETFRATGEGYLHVSEQPKLTSSEEALLLDRYIYESKGERIARQVSAASLMTRATMRGRVVVPEILQYGTAEGVGAGNDLSYWVDSEIAGVNAKIHPGVLQARDYMTVINWIIALQDGIREEGDDVRQDYRTRIKAFRCLIDDGYYERSTNQGESSVLYAAADCMMKWAEDSNLGRNPVFKHGDLHIANILKTEGNTLAIIDFEASIGGVGDNLKDLMKLLHLDYIFFNVHKSKEGSFLTNDERMALLDHYISNSGQDDVERLREPSYLLERVALDSLSRYTTRLTLAARQGGEPSSFRIQQTLRDMNAVMAGVEN